MKLSNEEVVITKNNGSSGAILFIMLLSMTAGSLSLNKVSPVINQIITSLEFVSEAKAGMLIAVFVLSGILLALPVGMIITRFGMYVTGLFALIAIIIGSILGVEANHYGFLLFSRLIEGVGLIFLSTIGPAAVGAAFSDKYRGAAMGLLMCFMAFGQIIMLNLAPHIAISSSWKNVWWFTALYSVIALIFWMFIIRSIDDRKDSKTFEQNLAAKETLREVLKNKYIWLIGSTFTLFLIGQQGTFAFLTRYLSEVRGIEVTKAGLIVSIASIVGIPVGMITGWVADKVGSRKYPLSLLMLACAISYVSMPIYPTSSYILMIIFYGIASMGIAGLCFSSVTEVIDKSEHINIAVSIINLMQWVGIFISTILFGFLIDKFTWDIAFYSMFPITILGFITAFLNKKLR